MGYPTKTFPLQAVFGIWPAAFVSLLSTRTLLPLPPQERRPLPNEAQAAHPAAGDEESEHLDLVLGTVLWHVTALADRPVAEGGQLTGTEEPAGCSGLQPWESGR